jgi:hypothetical protein
MKNLIFIEYDQHTAECVCRFADEFAEMPKAVQLDVAQAAAERLGALVASLEAIIARDASAGNS